MSVHTTNMISRIVLRGAFEAGATAMAGAIIGNPVGATVGALFGATRFIAQIPLAKGANRALNVNSFGADTAAKTLATAIRYIGSFAAAWGILALAGISLTLTHLVVLGAVGISCAFLLDLVLACNGIQIPSEVSI